MVAEPAEAVARIPEAAVQDAWVRGLFDPRGLRTTEGEPVRILARGRLNRDSGPDVEDARIEVGGVLWAGDVEVHTASAAWEAHGHHRDPAYNRVVLHVVLSGDRQTGTLRRQDGSALPEIVLLPRLHRSLRSLLHAFYLEPRQAPNCSPRWGDADPALRREWIRRLGAERLHLRARALARDYTRRPDLERLLIRRMFRALGYTANADAFEALADRIDLEGVRRLSPSALRDHLLALSGLERPDLFGLEGAPPPRALRPEAWKRGGRPANAPTRRIAQGAAWLAPGGVLHSDGVSALSDALTSGLEGTLDALRPDPEGGHRLGAARASRVLTDAVLPVLLVDAELREDHGLEGAVLDAYDALPSADDHVVRPFVDAGFRPRSATEAQGVHRLARDFCDEGRCARCAIGRALYPALAAE